jgi:hypothetical protein
MTIIGEYFCQKKELQEIPLLNNKSFNEEEIHQKEKNIFV